MWKSADKPTKKTGKKDVRHLASKTSASTKPTLASEKTESPFQTTEVKVNPLFQGGLPASSGTANRAVTRSFATAVGTNSDEEELFGFPEDVDDVALGFPEDDEDDDLFYPDQLGFSWIPPIKSFLDTLGFSGDLHIHPPRTTMDNFLETRDKLFFSYDPIEYNILQLHTENGVFDLEGHVYDPTWDSETLKSKLAEFVSGIFEIYQPEDIGFPIEQLIKPGSKLDIIKVPVQHFKRVDPQDMMDELPEDLRLHFENVKEINPVATVSALVDYFESKASSHDLDAYKEASERFGMGALTNASNAKLVLGQRVEMKDLSRSLSSQLALFKLNPAAQMTVFHGRYAEIRDVELAPLSNRYQECATFSICPTMWPELDYSQAKLVHHSSGLAQVLSMIQFSDQPGHKNAFSRDGAPEVYTAGLLTDAIVRDYLVKSDSGLGGAVLHYIYVPLVDGAMDLDSDFIAPPPQDREDYVPASKIAPGVKGGYTVKRDGHLVPYALTVLSKDSESMDLAKAMIKSLNSPDTSQRFDLQFPVFFMNNLPSVFRRSELLEGFNADWQAYRHDFERCMSLFSRRLNSIPDADQSGAFVEAFRNTMLQLTLTGTEKDLVKSYFSTLDWLDLDYGF